MAVQRKRRRCRGRRQQRERVKLAKRLRVEVGEDRVVGTVGLHLLASLCESVGLDEVFRGAIRPKNPFGFFIQDRGRILTHMAVALAGGASCLSDIRVVRDQVELFGDDLASDATVFRTFETDVGGDDWERIRLGLAGVRDRVWDRYGLAPVGRVFLDLDATLCDVHSEGKGGARPTYKSGFGFHPMVCFLDRDGVAEPLAGLFRPGNAGANTIRDQIEVIDAALAQLPDGYRVGHDPGDDPGTVRHEVVVRADAGSDTAVLGELAARNLGFLVSGAICGQLVRALESVDEAEWLPAVPSADHRRRDDPPDGDVKVSAVIEVTDRVEAIGHLPAGTRVILRREKLHPGAQARLWDDTWRYQIVYTNLDGDCVELEHQHRLRARCEQQMAILKDTGASSWPLTSLQGNTNWFNLVLVAQTILSWFAHAAFTGPLAVAHPKTLRYRILSAPGRIIRRGRQDILRIPRSWSWSADIIAAYHRLGIP